VERVELIVNGAVMWTSEGLDQPGSRVYEGEIVLPAAGWVAARAHGGSQTWPQMDPLVFAHTSPVWLGEVGSVDPGAAARAAADLMPVLDAAEARLRSAYGDSPTPRILADFDAARARLRAAMEQR
jgi:TolB protein